MEMRADISKNATEAEMTSAYTKLVSEQINVQIRAMNATLSPTFLPSDEWPLDLQFFPDIFETLEEAQAFLRPKCSKSWTCVCKSNRGYAGRTSENEPSWVLLNTCESLRRV